MSICVPDGVKIAVPLLPNRTGERRQDPQAKSTRLLRKSFSLPLFYRFLPSLLSDISGLTGKINMLLQSNQSKIRNFVAGNFAMVEFCIL